MNGPTMRRRACGSARRTVKPPMSAVRGTITRSIASQLGASPAAGSCAGKKLIGSPLRPAAAPGRPYGAPEGLIQAGFPAHNASFWVPGGDDEPNHFRAAHDCSAHTAVFSVRKIVGV